MICRVWKDHIRRNIRQSTLVFGWVSLLTTLAGCSAFTGPRNVTNVDPAVKIPEIRRAVDEDDRSVLPQLIEDLDSPDPAIRLYAIEGLRRLTGETFGYDWIDPDRSTRQEPIERWKQYMQSKPID
jgi:hypothetical protein